MSINRADIMPKARQLKDTTLRGADVVIATCGGALRPMLSSIIQPSLLIKDEDPQSPKWNFVSLVSQFDSLRVAIFAGDNFQKPPHINTLIQPGIPSIFALTPAYTAFNFVEDTGLNYFLE